MEELFYYIITLDVYQDNNKIINYRKKINNRVALWGKSGNKKFLSKLGFRKTIAIQQKTRESMLCQRMGTGTSKVMKYDSV